MFDQHAVLLDFQLRRGALNYMTKQRKNGLNPGDQLYHAREEIGSCVTQAFSKSSC
jgi:hypothetical protein